MKNVKKITSLFMSCLLIAYLIFSLAANGNIVFGGGKQKVILTMWYWNRSVEDQLIKDVTKAYPNIVIRATKIGGDYDTKLKTTMAAKSGLPDIFCINTNIADYYKYKDKFVNLLNPPYNATSLKKDYFDWKWNMCLTPDGKAMIAFPMDTGPTGLFYRKDYVEKVGLPGEPEQLTKMIKSWDDFFKVAQKLKSIGVYGCDNIGQIFISAMHQKTLLYINKNGKFVGDRQEVKDAFDMAVKAHKLGISAKVARYTTDWANAVSSGKVGMFTGAVWMKLILKDAAPNLSGKWRVILPPGGPGNEGGSFIAISSSSKHPQEAWQAIKWMMSAKNQVRQLKTVDLFPSAKAAFTDSTVFIKEPYFGNQETNRVFAESAKNIPVFYYGPNTSGIENLYTEQLTLVENQKKDPNKAWNDALNNIKKRYFANQK